MASFLIVYDKCEVPNNCEKVFFNELIKSHYFKDKDNKNNYKILSPYGLSEELLSKTQNI